MITIFQETRSYLDNATHGAVYFSLGTNVLSSGLDKEKIAAITAAFRQLAPVKILWKWDKDEYPEMPENVKLKKWLPQNDVLGESLDVSLSRPQRLTLLCSQLIRTLRSSSPTRVC